MERCAIFIDAGYLSSVLAKEFGGMEVDFGKLSKELSDGSNLLRAYYYNCPPFQSNPPTNEESERTMKANAFYDALRRLPRFEVRLGRLAKRSCRSCNATVLQQKRADLMLGVDLVNLSARSQIHKAVLIAGDSDFLPAVNVAKDNGVLIHLYHGGPANPAHTDLLDACDERTRLTKAFMDKVRKASPP